MSDLTKELEDGLSSLNAKGRAAAAKVIGYEQTHAWARYLTCLAAGVLLGLILKSL